MVKIVDGDLLESNEDIICQQVNCQGVMGSGLARLIRNKYPEVYTEYKNHCDSANFSVLGHCLMVNCKDGNYVANLFGQDDYGRANKQYTNYAELQMALMRLLANARTWKLSIGIPYEIGCGLGGGDWSVVYGIINEVFEDYDDVTIYKI